MKRLAVALIFLLCLRSVPGFGAAFQFPSNPSLNQEVTGPGGQVYVWDGTRWILKPPIPSLAINNPAFTGVMSGPQLKLGGPIPTIAPYQLLGMRLDANSFTGGYVINGNAGAGAYGGWEFYNNRSVAQNFTTYASIALTSSAYNGGAIAAADAFILSANTAGGIVFNEGPLSGTFNWYIGSKHVLSLDRHGGGVPSQPNATVMDLFNDDPSAIALLTVKNNLHHSTHVDANGSSTTEPDSGGLWSDFANGTWIGASPGPVGTWTDFGWTRFDGTGLTLSTSVGVAHDLRTVPVVPAPGVYFQYGSSILTWGHVLNISNAYFNGLGTWYGTSGEAANINLTGVTTNFFSHAATSSGHPFTNWTHDGGINHTGWFVSHLTNHGPSPVPGVHCADLAPGSRDDFGSAITWPQCNHVEIWFGKPFVGNSVCVAGGNGQPWNWMPYNQGPGYVAFQCIVPWSNTGCGGTQWIQWHCHGIGG